MYRLIILLCLVVASQGHIQAQVSQSALFTGANQLQSEGVVSALAIRSPSNLGAAIRVLIDGELYEIPSDPDGLDYSYFLSLPHPVNQPMVELLVTSPVTIFLIYSGTTPSISSKSQRKSDLSDCPIIFEAVSQAEWRSGLAAPNYTRSFTTVKHVVVHHAAGSNTSSNYTQVVRDIYLYHTEVNGWSDIGYNYLIAQDGTIYEGRDPSNGEQDNVLGAHFCGKNSGTMGICLLGNYETAQPTSSSLQALESLAAFKVQKENLDPFGQYPHTSGDLAAIIGHRDGCNTACPGENVYALLDDLRAGVETQITNCELKVLAFSASTWSPEVGEYMTFYNESVGYERYEWLLTGAETAIEYWQVSGSARWLIPGEFPVTIIGIAGNNRDTLTHENVITITSPMVFPTLAKEGQEILLNVSDGVEIETVFSLDGKSTSFQLLSAHSFQLLPAEPGIYLIELSDGKVGRVLIH